MSMPKEYYATLAMGIASNATMSEEMRKTILGNILEDYKNEFTGTSGGKKKEEKSIASGIVITLSWNDMDIHNGYRIKNKKTGFVFKVADEYARSGGIELDVNRIPTNRYFAPDILDDMKKAQSLSRHDRIITGDKSTAYVSSDWIVELPTGDKSLSKIKNEKRRAFMRGGR